MEAIVKDGGRSSRSYYGFIVWESDERLMAELPAAYQAILRETGAYVEIAQRINVPVGTVRSRLHRARAALMKLRNRSRLPQSH